MYGIHITNASDVLRDEGLIRRDSNYTIVENVYKVKEAEITRYCGLTGWSTSTMSQLYKFG